jgi:drug/metabolite transporter (DMT)-like permease
MDMETLKTSMICGSWVAFGYLGQLIGLLTTTASRSCVICSLHCVFVALVAELMRVSQNASASFDTKRLVPAAVAVAGVAIVELWGAAGSPTSGDLLSFAQPIGFGMGYLQLEELMKRRPDLALPVSAVKLGVVALASLLYFELGPWILSDMVTNSVDSLIRIPDLGAIFASPVALGGILYTGLVTTAMALWVESVAFARVAATDASVILTTEPLFAAGLGAVWLGETFGVTDYVGAALIISACILATLMDTTGDEKCVVEADPNCQTPRKWPFWGF